MQETSLEKVDSIRPDAAKHEQVKEKKEGSRKESDRSEKEHANYSYRISRWESRGLDPVGRFETKGVFRCQIEKPCGILMLVN